jgi:hypothetical protein
MTRKSLLVGIGASLLCACLGPSGGASRNPATDGAWLASAQREIAEREYRASENGEGLQAPNRAHDLRTYFDATGIRVHDRTASGSPKLLGLSLAKIGRGEALAAIAPGEVLPEGNRVEIRRDGLVEWYVNSPTGLEEGFTLAARPAGSEPVVVELAIADASPVLRGDAVEFDSATRTLRFEKLAAVDASGRALAAHFALAGAQHLRIVVDDAGAIYPLAIDPVLSGVVDAQLESNQGSTYLGIGVAGAGDVNGDGYADVIVGAPLYDNGDTDEGAAWLFLGSASGIASGNPGTASAQLESNQGSAELGFSVAGAGDVNGDGYADVIVGAPYYHNGETDEGAAFIFLGSASGIASANPSSPGVRLLESNQAGANLGISVAGAGDVNGDGYSDVIVSAPLYGVSQTAEGAAWLFLGSSTGIASGNPGTAAFQFASSQANAGGDTSGVPRGVNELLTVAGAGDVNGDGYADVILSETHYNANNGPAWLFMGSASGIASGTPATAAATLQGSGPVNAVASAGDVNGDGYADVLVGSVFTPDGINYYPAAFVFLGSASGFVSHPIPNTVLRSDQNPPALGVPAGAGDVNGDGYADVIVGDPSYNLSTSNGGAAWIYLGSASGIANSSNPNLGAAAHLTSNGDQSGAQFGTTVAGVGDVNGDGYSDAIVGAPFYHNGQTAEGAAFVYLGSSFGIQDRSQNDSNSVIRSSQGGAQLGTSVASAGDVNGDGYPDVIVGAPLYDNGQLDEGAAFVFLGGATGLAAPFPDPSTAAAQLESNQASAHLGQSVAGAGDVDGDGYADVIVGAPLYDNGQTDEGAAFLYRGSASGIVINNPPSPAAIRLESDQASANLGQSVAGAGDVNGDGYADVIVGAPSYDNGQTDEGAAWVFLGSASGIASGNPGTASAQLESNQARVVGNFVSFGSSVAGAGDVNGDGYADVIVGAPLYDAGQVDEGAAFVFRGSASGIANSNPASLGVAQLESNQALAQLGASVASAGDVNGDGYADVIVGGPGFNGGAGTTLVFLGSATGIASGSPATAATEIDSNQSGASLGQSVASAGDTNGDGYADVIIGAPTYPLSTGGAAFVFLGSVTGIGGINQEYAAAQIITVNVQNMNFGVSVAGGDFNADGFADLLVGANHDDRGQAQEGLAYFFLSNDNFFHTKGRPVVARQRRGDGSGVAVQPWGGAYSGTGFTAELRASHPTGRGRVKAQLQACPQGVPFGNGSCTNAVTPTWVTVNGAAPEALLSESFSGLVGNKLYRWRARILHANATGPLPTNPPHGPWRRLGAQSVEADIRLPEPGVLLALASGAVLVAALARRRRPV